VVEVRKAAVCEADAVTFLSLAGVGDDTCACAITDELTCFVKEYWVEVLDASSRDEGGKAGGNDQDDDDDDNDDDDET
jgi:hypothetical protein